MRKAALQLLVALLMYNPFGGELPLELFANSLQEYSDKLEVTPCCLAAVSFQQPDTVSAWGLALTAHG